MTSNYKPSPPNSKRCNESIGWVEGKAEKPPADSEGWPEGLSHQEHDSKGWVQGMLKRTDAEKRKDVILGNNLIDQPVISANDGRIVGKVKEFYLDENLEVITAIQLGSESFFNLSTEGFFHRKFTLVKRENISLFGLNAILIKNAEAITNSDEITELDTWLVRHDLQGREVDTPGGTKIGTIGDIIFDKEGHLVAFKLSRIFVEGLLAKAQTIAREVIVDTGREDGVITIDLAQAEQADLSVAAIAQ